MTLNTVSENAASIFIGMSASGRRCDLNLKYANRHGLITGATGTGKTATLQVLAEGFSACGVPVFAPDVKGDLAGISQLGAETPDILKRAASINMDYSPARFPVELWDVFGELGFRITATIDSMGPVLIGKLLDLTPVQAGALNVVMMLAADRGRSLKSLADLRSALVYAANNAKWASSRYGYVAPSTVGIIQRSASMLEQQGGNMLLSTREFDVNKLFHVDQAGRGTVNVLATESRNCAASPRHTRRSSRD